MAQNKHYSESDVGVGFATPPWIVEPLSDTLGGFDLDPASGAEPVPYADVQYTEEDDGLSKEWFGDVWLNPPYSRSENPKWSQKVSEEWGKGNPNTITALVPASTSTNWFAENYGSADILTFISHRVTFLGEEDCATFASVICSFGDFPQQYHNTLRNMREREDKPKPTVLYNG